MNPSKNNFKVDFIGIGVTKAGTTWIYKCLAEHPEICDSGVKEINFFLKINGRDGSVLKPKSQWKYTQGIEKYKQYFKDCPSGKLKGEFSPDYILDKNVPCLIKISNSSPEKIF